MNQFFFKINLNKFGELQKQKEEENKQFLSAVIASVVIIAICSGLLFFRVNSLDKKIKSRKKLSSLIKKRDSAI
jgi:capsular polysaccharide biosynthesis protein